MTVELQWWPKIANEWISRKRVWPSQKIVDSLATKCHLIDKPYDDDVNDVLRYSFAWIEKELIHLRIPQQKLVYLIFKSMIYKWIKPINPDQISSFIGKTVMFWVVEETNIDSLLWYESDEAIVQAITLLFTRLKNMLEQKFIPFYFVPSINIIDNMANDIRVDIIGVIDDILKNLVGHIPDNVTDVCKKLTSMGLLVPFFNNFNISIWSKANLDKFLGQVSELSLI